MDISRLYLAVSPTPRPALRFCLDIEMSQDRFVCFVGATSTEKSAKYNPFRERKNLLLGLVASWRQYLLFTDHVRLTIGRLQNKSAAFRFRLIQMSLDQCLLVY